MAANFDSQSGPQHARGMLGAAMPLRDHVLVLHARPDAVAAELAQARYLPVLTDAERAQHLRFRFEDDRHTYLVAHGLLRMALSEMLRQPPRSIELTIGEHGKPELAASADGLRFNLSHTRGLVACAFGLGDDLGVDVEHIDRKLEIATLAPSVLSVEEQAAVEALSGFSQRVRFFRYWTLKEAYVKATGRGIAEPLRALHVELDQGETPTFSFRSPFQDDGGRWWLASQTVHDAFVLGVAVCRPTPPVLRLQAVAP